MYLLIGIHLLFMVLMINSEDYALLMGSLALFAIVGGIMIITRKIDWYKFGKLNNCLLYYNFFLKIFDSILNNTMYIQEY